MKLNSLLGFVFFFSIFMQTAEAAHFHVASYRLLDHKTFPVNPMDAYKKWMPDAANHHGALATINGAWPEMRIIRIRGVTKDGLVFYSNPASNKIKQIKSNKHVSLLIVNKVGDDFRVVKLVGNATLARKAEKHTIGINGKSQEVLWAQYIVKPTLVHFTERTQHDGVGVIQYINYNLIDAHWEKKSDTKYLTPSPDGAGSDN